MNVFVLETKQGKKAVIGRAVPHPFFIDQITHILGPQKDGCRVNLN